MGGERFIIQGGAADGEAPMTSFSIVSLILAGKKEEPVILSVSGEKKIPNDRNKNRSAMRTWGLMLKFIPFGWNAVLKYQCLGAELLQVKR